MIKLQHQSNDLFIKLCSDCGANVWKIERTLFERNVNMLGVKMIVLLTFI